MINEAQKFPTDKKTYDKNYESAHRKECSKCSETKPLSEFYFFKSQNRYDSRCKVCARKQSLSRYHSNNGQKYIRSRRSSGKQSEAQRKYDQSEKGQKRVFTKKLEKYGLTKLNIRKE